MNTSKYLKTVILSRELTIVDLKELAPFLNGMRIISNNVNQIARKANETNNIYKQDIEIMKEEVEHLCRIVNTFASTAMSGKA